MVIKELNEKRMNYVMDIQHCNSSGRGEIIALDISVHSNLYVLVALEDTIEVIKIQVGKELLKYQIQGADKNEPHFATVIKSQGRSTT